MPRTRFARQLFVLWCGLAAVIVAVCQWWASVELARLADAMQVRRMTDAGAVLVALLPEDAGGDGADFAVAAREMERSGGLSIVRYDADGQPSVADGREGTEGSGDGGSAAGMALEPAAVTEALREEPRTPRATMPPPGGGSSPSPCRWCARDVPGRSSA